MNLYFDLMLEEELFERMKKPGWKRGQGAPFTKRISSQLLLYRIVVMFDMISPESEGYADWYKSWWDMLAHADGESRLSFFDYKGWGSLYFKGTEEGSRDAMELLDFLTEREIPHSYDGILAGTVA